MLANLKYLGTLLLLCLVVVVSCKKEDTTGELLAQKLTENNETIQNYIVSHGLEMQTTESGLYYNITGSSNDLKPDTTYRHVTVKYEVRLLPSETVVDTLYSLAGSSTKQFPWGAGLALNGMEEGLQLMSRGSKATLLMPYTLGYGAYGNPFLPPYSAIRVDVELIDVQSEGELIKEYFTANNLTATSITDDLFYLRLQDGDISVPVTDSSKITVNYTGKFLNNKVFDSGLSYELVIKKALVIDGWKKGLILMNKGEKALLGIPSKFAYGKNGSKNSAGQYVIPPYEPLLFEIEVLTVEKDE